MSGDRAGKAILFDLDGTLSDPKSGLVNCVNHALQALGRAPMPAAELDWMIGPPLHESFEKLLGAEMGAKAVTLYRQRYGEIGLFENTLYPGVAAALADIAKLGAPMFVATAKLEPFAQRIIAHFGLSGFFAQVYGSQPDGARARKSELIAHICAQEKISGGVMIGDRAYDALGAKANGFASIGVLWGYGARSELAQAGCDALVARMDELKPAVAALL
jgi:phosphoglycolate phosphatase